MNGSVGMSTVTVKKDELLATVRANRETHRTIFLEAVQGFRAKAIEMLDERLKDAVAGRRIDISIHLPRPVDQTRDYDKVIKMLEMSVDDEIELTQNEFTQYVMDDWSWKKQFSAVNKTYTVSAADNSPLGDED
jgi:hypothetical protein